MKQTMLCYNCGQKFLSRNMSSRYCSISCKASAEGNDFKPPSNELIRFAIFSRDGFRCFYCGATSESSRLEIDHCLPVIEGGPHEPENVVTSCASCNRAKHHLRLKPEILTNIWDRAFDKTDNDLRVLFDKWRKTKRKKRPGD